MMFSIEKISSDEKGHQKVVEFLERWVDTGLMFDSSFPLLTWFTSKNRELYLASYGSEAAIIMHRLERQDIRFLLRSPSKELVSEVISHFDIRYVGVNELSAESKENSCITFQQYVIDIETVAELKDKKVRKDYNQFLKKHPDLHFKEFEYADMDAIKDFLEEWSHTRSEQMNQFSRIHNDLNFLQIYKDHKDVTGGVVYDKEKVVAITFFVPSRTKVIALAMINKTLRGYTQLGVFTFVERARLMKAKGFTKANIGSINNDFKRKFLFNSTALETYAYEAWKKEGLDFSPRFLEMFL